MDTNLHERFRWFWHGMTSISIFPDLPELPQRTDAEAIASDWQQVGDGIRESIRAHSCEFVVKSDAN